MSVSGSPPPAAAAAAAASSTDAAPDSAAEMDVVALPAWKTAKPFQATLPATATIDNPESWYLEPKKYVDPDELHANAWMPQEKLKPYGMTWSQCLKGSRPLVTLRGYTLVDQDIFEIADSFAHDENKSLTSLDMSGNFDKHGVSTGIIGKNIDTANAIAGALMLNTTLTHFNMAHQPHFVQEEAVRRNGNGAYSSVFLSIRPHLCSVSPFIVMVNSFVCLLGNPRAELFHRILFIFLSACVNKFSAPFTVVTVK
jgi:hypothetical protein